MSRLLNDSDALGGPTIHFVTRFGHESIPSFDDMYPGISRTLESIPSDQWLVYIRVADTHAFSGVPFAGHETEEVVACALAEGLQLEVIESRLLGTTWPRCPRHRMHPLWPALVSGAAVWQCKTEESIVIPIGGATTLGTGDPAPT